MQLNAFQLLMRDWTKLGPYNAGQAMCISGRPDQLRWEAAARTVIALLGLGRPHVQGTQAFFYKAEPICIPVITDAVLATIVGREMNQSFSEDDFPIRLHIVAEVDHHWLLLVCNHWIADSFALRSFMGNLFKKYQDPASVLTPLTLQSADFQSLYRPYLGRVPLLTRIRMSSANALRHRQAFRLNLANPMDFHSNVSIRHLPEDLIQTLHERSHELSCTVHDLFLTALSRACGILTAKGRYSAPRRPFRHRRDKLALGTIVDIRNSASQSLEHVFGLYLSCYTMIVARPEERSMTDLAESIGGHSRWIKQSQQNVRRFGTLKTAHIWWHFFDDPRQQASFFHKASPTVAGISNVNLTGAWMDQLSIENSLRPTVLDYLRISPTGPLLPIVFTLTTIRSRLSLCVTYRTTALNQQQADTLITNFCEALVEISRCKS